MTSFIHSLGMDVMHDCHHILLFNNATKMHDRARREAHGFDRMGWCRATRDYAGARTAQLLLIVLMCSAGMFSASTALLPSSFVMQFVTLAASAVIDNRPLLVVIYAVMGVILGWVVAGENAGSAASSVFGSPEDAFPYLYTVLQGALLSRQAAVKV